jgi:segregation and condensation protein B
VSQAVDGSGSSAASAPPVGLEQQSRLVEGILVVEAEPQSTERLARLTGVAAGAVRAAVAEVQRRFAEPDHGVQVLEVAGGFTLVPKPELWPWLRHHYGRFSRGNLSRAALETLAIVAYSQPITRSEIESIRGVSPDGMMRLLGERNLIREVGRTDAPGRPIQYGTSGEFLRVFGLTSIADLPKLAEADREKFKLPDG